MLEALRKGTTMAGMDHDRWQVLEPLLDRVLDLTADERESWLVDLRVHSPVLAAELTSLLSGESAADRRGFLAQPPDVKLEGLELGAYTLEHSLGHGGMGSVWLARRTDGRFEGSAAVKFLNLSLMSLPGQARFRREGSVLARLAHPAIARLLDAGVSPGGQPYLVLEYVDGQPIDAYANEHGLSLDARVRLMLEVLAAVGHAHANLIVHRDLKPSNILVAGDGAVKLLDFGIAKLLDADATGERTELTVEGGRALTPEFAAPEQASGGAITTATDVYACGVLLYLLASGHHPTAEGCRTPAEAIRALFDVQPARLGLGDLDTVLEKALRKEPSERYQTVAAVAEDLERYLRHEPVSARRTSMAYRARKFVRRHRGGVAAAAVVLATLMGATAFSIAQMREARRQRDTAVYARRRANAQVEFQTLLMSQVGDQPLTMREILDRGRTALVHEYTSKPRLLASILVQLADRYGQLGDRSARSALLARAESLAVATSDSAALIEVRCSMVDNLRSQGRYVDAQHMMQGAESMLHVRPDPRTEAACLQSFTELENEAGVEYDGVPAMRRAIALLDTLGETSDMLYITMLSTLGGALDRQGDHREALAVQHHVVAIMDSSGRGETMGRAILEHDYADALRRVGETADAERLFHDVLERIARSDPAGRIPQQALIHYGHTALFEDHADSAAKYFALLEREGVDVHNPFWEGRALFGLAEAQLRLGRLADARRTVERFRVMSDNPDLQHSDDQVTDVRMLDGLLALAVGDTAGAYQHVVEMLRAYGYADGKRRSVFRVALMVASETALALGRPAEALGYARAARMTATVDSLAETRSAYVGEARLLEARALLASGDSSEARAAAARALVALRNGAGGGHPRTRQAEQLSAMLQQ